MALILDVVSWVCMGVVGFGFLIYFLLRISEPIELWWRARREARVDYARFAAEQTIRDTERRTIAELLAVYHREKGGDDENVIESTAVEFRS